MTMLKRFPFFVILFGMMAMMCIGLTTNTAHAQQAVPMGSCGDTVSDDAGLFGNRALDVVNQAKAINDALQADTRVVTVSTDKLAGSSLKSYYTYVVSQCPTWNVSNSVVLVEAKGLEPFLHLGSKFSGKMTSADFQQMTLSIRSEYVGGNYAQATIDLLQQVQKKLSPDYTWLWVTLVVVVVLVVAGVLAAVFLRRRQVRALATSARDNATRAKQAAVNATSQVSGKIDELSPRLQVLQALVPPATAAQLSGAFETAKEQASRVQERLGNLLGNPDTNPNSTTVPVEQYGRMQRDYQEVYNEAQEPQYLLHAVETAVQRLERNPQEQINMQQILAQGSPQGSLRVSQPGYPSESTWSGR